ncbi:MAG: UDP-N-acetylmuramoyl-tripeptide--D-alanyl-D-alanine ligase [Lysobacteraceae bacterium]
MTPMTLSRIAQATGGRLVGDDRTIGALVTDTRRLDASGSPLFVALRGEHFDGNDYVAQAAERGAAAALVSREADVAIPQVVVADTERALAALAASVQRGRKTRVLAVTGSNGKTSVKALVSAILEAAAPGRAYHTPGNRNNEIGLPLAVLDAPDDALYAIYEMGAGKPGDIAYLTDIVRPDASLVNNIAPAHLERMGSLLGIADTKSAIYDALPEHGTAAINADDAFSPYFSGRAEGRRQLRFALDADADLTARDIALAADGSRFVLVTPEGEAEIALAMPGRHNVSNALAAAALAMGVGIGLPAIAAGLNAARPVGGRLNVHALPGGASLIDDSYNANPGSLQAAIDTLSAVGGERWLVIGDMRELGADAAALHVEVGRRAKAAGIARLYALGPLSAGAADAFGEGGRTFEQHAALATVLRADIAEAATAPRVLVKGSRGSAMDRIVNDILAGGGDGGTTHAA